MEIGLFQKKTNRRWRGEGELGYGISRGIEEIASGNSHGSHQKNWFKFQDFPRLFFTFPGLLWSCTNINNKISFLQNKNIHSVVYRNNSSFYSKSKKWISPLIYIMYYYIHFSLMEIDPLYYLFDLNTEKVKVITENDSSVNTNGPRTM